MLYLRRILYNVTGLFACDLILTCKHFDLAMENQSVRVVVGGI